MPPKKSNLNNARSKEARRKRVERAHQSAEQTIARNAAQRVRTAEGRAHESQEQRDERLRQTITRTRAAREQNIATARGQERQRQRTSAKHSTDNVNLREQVACTRANKNSEQRNQRLRADTLRKREARQPVTNAHRKRNQRRNK
ncbi:PREDICTED: histone-lysine N-methyltransferase, H3 lysine-79 specific-like [Polistes dominula]|uniref:Histone-lysine N-methyltransferase, H3 lysine-79 specific-like n=1 Tax=Polistes dominula TaxID=743375 RepID=A0ABM1IS69_POLDO|nr:PREDICTED: histone-lysine N-methyltransferase, H3 lysine-79 specific-like [Polistes dominula]